MKSKITRRSFNKILATGSLGLLSGCYIFNKYDIIIKNGSIIDGTGVGIQIGDLGIIGNKIHSIGHLKDKTASIIIDAKDHIVSPGFIDIHTHTDVELLVNPNAESKIFQGVTTEVSGNCGYSPFPLNENDFEEYRNDLIDKYGLNVNWQNLTDFLNALEENKISINYATFTGHGNLRSFVVGKNDVTASADEIIRMKDVLNQTMSEGSLGLSTGLEYAPGSYASTEELIELNKIVSQNDGVYATHIRDEEDTVEEAVKEALEICEKADVSTQISHLKANYKSNWHKIDNILNMIHNASDSGMPVKADRYPYIAYGTGLTSFLPLWSRQGDTDEILDRLINKNDSNKIQEFVESKGKSIGGWDLVVISSCNSEKNKKLEGRSILDCSESTNKYPYEFIRDLLIEERNKVGIVGFGMSEDNLKKVLSSSLVMIGSDGNAVSPKGKLGEGKPHPRYYGTFPRVLGKYSRKEGLFDLPTAIKKMTSMPAQKLGIKKRGVISRNNFADIVVFNPDTIIDNATFTNPHQLATGIEYVIVNGKVIVNKGLHTEIRSGTVIRKNG